MAFCIARIMSEISCDSTGKPIRLPSLINHNIAKTEVQLRQEKEHWLSGVLTINTEANQAILNLVHEYNQKSHPSEYNRKYLQYNQKTKTFERQNLTNVSLSEHMRIDDPKIAVDLHDGWLLIIETNHLTVINDEEIAEFSWREISLTEFLR